MTTRPDLRTYLRMLAPETLIDLLCEQAERDPELRRRLEVRAAEHGADGLGGLTDDPAPGAEQDDTVQFGSVLDTVQRLLDAGTSADITPLAKRTVDRIITTAGEAEELPPSLAEALGRAVSLYARACTAHPPPACQLADWIVRLAFDGAGWPGTCLADFADALGRSGLAHVQAAVESVLAENTDERRARTARVLRLELAEITGDVDTVVSVLSEQLPRLDVSLRIVRVLRAAGRHGEAIAHAAKALSDRGCRGAGSVGTAAREPVIEALERVRTQQEPVDTSDVERLLALQRCDEAWPAASAHEPADVIPLYHDHVERLIDSRNPVNYQRAAAQLRRLRTLYRKAGTPREFSVYLAQLLDRHRRKSRLLDEIAKARLALPRSAGTPGSQRPA